MLQRRVLALAAFLLDLCVLSGANVVRAEDSNSVASSPYQPWVLPAAKDVIARFGISPSDILAVQKVVAYIGAAPADSAEAVVTSRQWYYRSLTDGQLYDTAPPRFGLATEMDVYGSSVECYAYCWFCPSSEWAVTFYMPACFHEDSPGYFSEIQDAWAPTPDCNRCNGGWCADGKCDKAWDGPGYLGWRNYKDCDVQNLNSRKLGKIVQKRWLMSYRNCGYPDWQIANSVRAHIRF